MRDPDPDTYQFRRMWMGIRVSGFKLWQLRQPLTPGCHTKLAKNDSYPGFKVPVVIDFARRLTKKYQY